MRKTNFLTAVLAFLCSFIFASNGAARVIIDFNETLDPFGSEVDFMDIPFVESPVIQASDDLVMDEQAPVEDDVVRERYYRIKKFDITKHQSFDINQIRTLFFNTDENEVAGLDYIYKYDPTEALGFCFGRAMAAHLIALKMGLKEENIKKLFVVGDLRSTREPEWRFHVTTIVKGPDNVWYAIDPVLSYAMRMDTWIGRVQSIWDRNRKAIFYITRADAIMPDMSFVPAIEEEKGENIIELAFNPLNKPGFDKKNIRGDMAPVFELSEEAIYKYFSDVGEREDRFDFTHIVVNGASLSYNNYFAELTENVLSSPMEEFLFAETYSFTSASTSPMDEPVRTNLGSMKLHLFK